jgi:uncharacterized protein (DUF1778 family)
MKKTVGGGRRKRGGGKDAHNKPVWAYFNDDERTLIEQASTIERRSMSSFVSDAALSKAEEILRIYNRSVMDVERQSRNR